MKKKENKWSVQIGHDVNTAGGVLDLQAVKLGSFLGTLFHSLSLPGVIPKYRN